MGGGVGGCKLKLRLNSAKAEAQASSLSLAELGNIFVELGNASFGILYMENSRRNTPYSMKNNDGVL